MESSLHFHPLKKDASLCSSTECSQMTPQKCEQLALNSSTKEVKWIVPEKCSNSAGQLWCEKKLNTVRVTKFCSSSTQINEKLDVSRLKDDATDTSKLTSIEELQAINNFEKVTVLVKAISTNPPDAVNDIPHQDVFFYRVDAIPP